MCCIRGDVLEGLVDFKGKHMWQGLFFIERESLVQVFSCGFHGATTSVTKNMGATNKQHKITADMVDLTKPMFSFYVYNAYTSMSF